MPFVTEQEKARIETAIGTFESATNGELVAVITDASDSYVYIPLLIAAMLALAALPVSVMLQPALEFTLHYVIQLCVFIGSWALLRLPTMRRHLVPRHVQHHRASRFAHELFVRLGVHDTTHRAGILLFVSIEERYVELIADRGIADKVPDTFWESAISQFVSDIRNEHVSEGFLACIGQCNDVLVTHFPADASAQQPDELSNRLVTIQYEAIDESLFTTGRQ